MRKALISIILLLFAFFPLAGVLAQTTNYRYTGQELDPSSGLYYYGQRYYQPEVGRFTQPDPVLKNLNDPRALKQQTGQDLEQLLSNPQALNEYSYVQNNPVKYIDEEGEWFKEFMTGKQSWSDFQMEVGEAAMHVNPVMEKVIDHPYISGAVIGVGVPLAATGIGALVERGLIGLGLASRALPPTLISQSQRIFQGSQNFKNKEVATGALTKLQDVSKVIGKSVDSILQQASKSKSVFTDLRSENYGNVNVFFQNPVNNEKLIRITLDPTLNKIISAGFDRINQVQKWINEGDLAGFSK